MISDTNSCISSPAYLFAFNSCISSPAYLFAFSFALHPCFINFLWHWFLIRIHASHLQHIFLLLRGKWKWGIYIFNWTGSDFYPLCQKRKKLKKGIPVCNFQSMKSLVEQPFFKILFLNHLVVIDATLDDLQTRPLRQILLFLQNNSLTL